MEPVQVIRSDLVLVDWGPMTLTISAWQGGQARPVMAAQAARAALRCLKILADFQGYMRRRMRELPAGRPLPPVVERAAQACRAVDSSLTPLAAVAGAVADEVADFALNLGADRVVVNNGGDIAVRLQPGQSLRVGVKPPDSEQGEGSPLMGRLNLRGGDGIGGVASSGWQGRSFSAGVADLVTVWAASAAQADAAATALGNAAQAQSAQSAPAQDIEPDCGLGKQQVTTQVGPLPREERLAALRRARDLSRRLHARGLIIGCLVLVQGEALLLDRGQRIALAGPAAAAKLLAA
ncbi:MAG: FAD:protein FMN transferase [Deltaproteobacteria bacterium]|nr:FAD:protein FMN transferase [Deltaproteobacteria bacterium]